MGVNSEPKKSRNWRRVDAEYSGNTQHGSKFANPEPWTLDALRKKARSIQAGGQGLASSERYSLLQAVVTFSGA